MTAAVNEDTLVSILKCSTSEDLTVFVDQGIFITDELLVNAGHSQGRLNLIATYLSAHFYTLAAEKGALASTEIGEAKDRFHNTYNKGFGMTRFGQQAIVFDSSGILAQESVKIDQTTLRKAEFRVV